MGLALKLLVLSGEAGMKAVAVAAGSAAALVGGSFLMKGTTGSMLCSEVTDCCMAFLSTIW